MDFKNFLREDNVDDARNGMIERLKTRWPKIMEHVKLGNTTDSELWKVVETEIRQICSRAEVETAKKYIEIHKRSLEEMIKACKIPDDIADKMREYRRDS